MGWFGKKEEQTVVSAPKQKVSEEAQPAGNDRNRCVGYLKSILEDHDRRARGVVVKLHIENFKRLNQVFSYAYCEELLDQIIRFLEETTGVPVYRYVGVEFIMVLEQSTIGQAMELCEAIGEQFNQVWKINQTDCLCTVQMGICSYPGHASTVEEMLKYLDLAVSKAADYGPNKVAVYDGTLHSQLVRRQLIAGYLNSAVDMGEVEVRFRPTYHIEKQKFVRAELYMRIFVKGLGMIGSVEFLPVAEDSGQIWMLECFALDQVGACIRDLMDRCIDFESISTRISPVVFMQENFLDEVQQVIDRYRIPKGKMALEITESVFTTAYLDINIMLQQLVEMGVEMILNDFGSGYSSVASILELPVETVKFERLFIWQIEGNPKASILIDGLVKLAKNLGLRTIAEGVETEKQLEVLNGANCGYQQGFYYSPTISRDALRKVMDTSLDESAAILEAEKEKMR